MRKRLAKFIKTRLQSITRPGKGSSQAGTGGRLKSGSGGQSPPRDMSDDHLPNVPTKLEFQRNIVRVNQGATGYSWVEIDAKNGDVPAHDDALTLSWDGTDPGEKLRLSMRSKLLGGKSRWLFEATGDAEPGDYTFRASLLTANGGLTDTVTITVAVPAPAKPGSSGPEPETGPRVEWVTRDDWPNHDGMTARTVGYVTADEEETIIWVNRHYHLLDAALKGRTLTPEAIETRATRYQFPVACALWLQFDDLKRTAQKPDEHYQEAERERMAEAVLVAIDPDVDAALEESED